MAIQVCAGIDGRTAEQDTAWQTDALHKAGGARVFEDTASGAKADRPGLADALACLRDGNWIDSAAPCRT